MVIITHIELANSDRGPPIFSIPPTGINEEESKAFDLQNKHPIRIIQQGVSSNITPRGFYCYHISMIQDFEHRNDFTILMKLKDILFGIDSDVILGESRIENKHVIAQSMMDIIERKQEEERRIGKFKRECEHVSEEERQIQEAIRQSLEGDGKYFSFIRLANEHGVMNSNLDKDTNGLDANSESKEEEKAPYVKIYTYSDISSSDIIYSCVYNQYCRLPNNKQNSHLTNVTSSINKYRMSRMHG
jgi:hypothetical protein